MYFEKESFLHFSKCITVAQVEDLFLHVGLARIFQLALSPAFQKSLWVINHVITLQTGTTGWRKFLDLSAVFSHISSSTCSFVDNVEILSVSACLTTIFIWHDEREAEKMNNQRWSLPGMRAANSFLILSRNLPSCWSSWTTRKRATTRTKRRPMTTRKSVDEKQGTSTSKPPPRPGPALKVRLCFTFPELILFHSFFHSISKLKTFHCRCMLQRKMSIQQNLVGRMPANSLR